MEYSFVTQVHFKILPLLICKLSAVFFGLHQEFGLVMFSKTLEAITKHSYLYLE